MYFLKLPSLCDSELHLFNSSMEEVKPLPRHSEGLPTEGNGQMWTCPPCGFSSPSLTVLSDGWPASQQHPLATTTEAGGRFLETSQQTSPR